MKKRLIEDLNLQLFASGGDDGNANDDNPNDNGSGEVEQNTDNNSGADDTGNENEKRANEKTFTQADVDRIVAERLERERNKNKSVKKEKPETKAGNESDSEVLKQLQQMKQEFDEMKIKNTALSKGIEEKNIPKVLALAELEEGDSIEDKISNVLKEYPFFAKGYKEEEKNKDFFGFDIKNSNGKQGTGKTTAQKLAEEANSKQEETKGLNPWAQ